MERVARSTLIPAFTARVLRDLLTIGSSRSLEVARTTLERLGVLDFDARLSEVLEGAYSVLMDVYPGEYVLLNECLCREMTQISGQGAAYRELAVGSCKADLALFCSGESKGFEIKSRFDRLDRLQAQLQTYQEVFSHTYVVTDHNHVRRVLEDSPASVGVLSVSSDGIQELRPATARPDLICLGRLFSLLRKDEYLQLIREEFGVAPRLPNTQTYRACLGLFRRLDGARAQELVTEILCRRQSRPPPAKDRAWRLPRSLRALALTGNLSQSELLRLSHMLEY